MKKAIVFGATGFIGNWLVDELVSHNYEVTVIMRNKEKCIKFHHKNIINVCLEREDILNVKIVHHTYDYFFYLAWEGVAPESKNNINVQLKNIQYAIDAMKLAKRVNCKRFIATGTVAEYAFCKNIMDVNKKQTPNDFYGAVKVSVHYILDILSRQLNLDFIWAVLPSTFGPGRQDNNIITYTIKTLLAGNIPYYGNLEQMWDFLYVTEVAKALRLIAEHGINGKTYGIGSGQFKKLKEYILIVRDIINPELSLGIGKMPEMSGKTFSSCVGIYDLINDTGFYVEISFEEGIKNTVNYMKSIK